MKLKKSIIIFLYLLLKSFAVNAADKSSPGGLVYTPMIYMGSSDLYLLQPGTGTSGAALPRKSSYVVSQEVRRFYSGVMGVGFDINVFLTAEDRKQNLSPVLGNLNPQSDRNLQNSSLEGGINLGLNFYFPMGKNFNLYGKYQNITDFRPHYNPIYLTNDPNRSTACATAVNNALADPTLPPDAITTSCQALTGFQQRGRGALTYGLEWSLGQWILQVDYLQLKDYNFKGWVVHNEPSWMFGLGYRFK